MKFFKGFFVFFLASGLTSCISSRFIDIQVLNPSSVELPSNITLHIVEPQNVDSEYRILLRDTSLNQSYFCKLLIHNFDSTIVNHLEESPMFGNSKIVFQSEREFQKEMATQALAENKNHVLMSIDKLDLIENKIFVDYDQWNFEYLASYSFY